MRVSTLARLAVVAVAAWVSLSGIATAQMRAQPNYGRPGGAPVIPPYAGGHPSVGPASQVVGDTMPSVQLAPIEPRSSMPNGRLRNSVMAPVTTARVAQASPWGSPSPARGSNIVLVQSDMPTTPLPAPRGTPPTPAPHANPFLDSSDILNPPPLHSDSIAPVIEAPTQSVREPSISDFRSSPSGSGCASCGNQLGNCGCTSYSESLFAAPDSTCLDSFQPPCNGCGDILCDDGCALVPRHRVELFGEFLYLRPRDAQVAYAVPIDSPAAATLGNGIQAGPAALVDPNHNAGFRVGGGVALSDCSVIGAEFASFQSHIGDQAFASAPLVLRSLVTHPLGANAATDGLRAWANLDIDFRTVDLTYRGMWRNAQRLSVDYVLGVRHGQLEQEFASQFMTNGFTWVDTDISFNGTGPLVGLRLDRPVGCVGLFLYGRGDAAFLVGKSDAYYQQRDSFQGTVVDTRWESGRVVSQLGMEVGLGWANASETFRLSGGYLVNAWYNAVRTDEFVQSVQQNNFVGLGDGLTFDGFALRGELRF